MAEDQTLKGLEEQVIRELSIKHIGPDMTTEDAGKLGGFLGEQMEREGRK
jgi:hypothetical protein